MSNPTLPPGIALRETWSTPPDFRKVIVRTFGTPALDTCADAGNAFTAGPYFDGIADNGLMCPWCRDGRWNWCNPPGGQLPSWVAKARYEQERGASSLVLVQDGLQTDWYQVLADSSATWLLRPRPQFVPPAGVKDSSNARNYILIALTPWMLHAPTANAVQVWEWRRMLDG